MSAGEFRTYLAKAASGGVLTPQEAMDAFNIIMSGVASDAQIASFSTALHMRGETIDEIAAAAKVLRARMVPVEGHADAIDMVGTGGDGFGTLNISTCAALVAAACGAKVAKHGNRAQSSKSGAADVLNALGVNLDLTPNHIARCMAEAGIGFMFAPAHHQALKHVAAVRQQLGFRTIFNLLGPLCNPAQVKRQLLGVFDEKWLEPFAKALQSLGSEHAWVVHSADGLDELSVTGPNFVVELNGTVIRRLTLNPADAGLPLHSMEKLLGGDAQQNAEAIRKLLNGEHSAYRDIVCLNAAAALVIADKATSLRDGVERAQRAIDSGAAHATLAKLVLVSNTASSGILGHIARYKRNEIAASQISVSLEELEHRARNAPAVRPFVQSLRSKIEKGQFALIAEIKKASPSKGVIREDFDPPALARAYEAGGATCLSVLTDGPSFQGCLDFLAKVREVTNLPILRKDFMFDVYQIVESRAIGADCILLIMAALTDQEARSLNEAAQKWGMDVLVEVHDHDELERALKLQPTLIGVNNRNLNTFETSLTVTETLAPNISAGIVVVSESGISSYDDLRRLSNLDVRAFLVGESLMRQADVAGATRTLLGGKA